MIKLGMRSVAAAVKGQGVGSAYEELIKLLQDYGKENFEIRINRKLASSDLVHVHTIDPTSFLTMLFCRKPSVVSVHFIPETMKDALRIPKPFLKIFNAYTIWVYRNADHVHVVNPGVKTRLEEYGIKKNRIHCIPNVVSTDGFYKRDEAEREAIRRQYGWSKEDFIVLGCGQVQTKKGVAQFAETARLLPDVKFVWVGGFSFGGMSDGYPELKKLMDDPPDNLLFTGIVPREEVSKIMGAVDVFFLPSFHEQCCMSVLEAATSELPILLRDLPDYHRLYGDNYFYDTQPAGFAAHLRTLRDDPALCAEQAKKAKKISCAYSEERIFAMWKKYYTKIAAAGKKKCQKKK